MKFTFSTFSITIAIITVFMIAGLYTWIILGLDVQNQQLQIIEKQNRDLNNKQLQLQNTTLTNQEIIKHSQKQLHELLTDETSALQQLKVFQVEEPDANRTK